MRKILRIILIVMTLCLITGCSEKTKISFNINNVVIDVVINCGEAVYVNDVPVSDYNVIEGIYYDEAFSKEYRNEPITENITLYIKLKPQIVNVTFWLNGIKSELCFPIYITINVEQIPLNNKEELLGIFYDANFENEYNDELITRDTVLYVKTNTDYGYLPAFDDLLERAKLKYALKYPNEIVIFQSYLGTYDEKIALVFSSQKIENIEIATKSFVMKGKRIVIFYNDEIKTLQEAFNQNIISSDEVEKINNIYIGQYFSEYGGAE